MPPGLGCGEQWIETVLTCEGDYYDPDLPRKLTVFNSRLQQILRAEKERLVIKKVEPWNSVKVTLNIPPEAALRLRALAEDGSQALRNLGILAVQEGDRVISLTLAGAGAGLQKAPPTVGAGVSSPSCTTIAGNNAVGLSHCSDRSTLANDRLLNSSVIHKLGSPPPAINGCHAPIPPALLLGQSEPAKRPRKAAAASRGAGSKRRAVDQGSARPAAASALDLPSAAAGAAASAAPASLLASSEPKPRQRSHSKAASSDASKGTSVDTRQHGVAVPSPAKPPADGARSAQAPRSSAACLVSLVGNLQPSTSRSAPLLQMAPGPLALSPSPAAAAGSSAPHAAGESIKAISDIITSLHAATSSRTGVYAAAGEPPVAASAPAVSGRHRPADGRAVVATSGSGGGQAHPHRAAAGGGSSIGQPGGCSTSSVPRVMAKHLYHPAGEDRHSQDAYRMRSLATDGTHRYGGSVVASAAGSISLSLLSNSEGAEQSSCSYDASHGTLAGADGLRSCEQQRRRSHVAGSRVHRLPSPSDRSSHTRVSGASPSMTEPDSSAARAVDHSRQVAAGESLLQGHAFAPSSGTPDRRLSVPSPADQRRGAGDCGIGGQDCAAADALRRCESPTVVDHLEGTIMSVVGDEGEEGGGGRGVAAGSSQSRATFEDRDGICVVSIGVTQAFTAAATRGAAYAIPPCLDIAKMAADLQSSSRDMSPVSSPAALAALAKHELASSETETESASAVSVDSGVASSSPKSDLGEPGAGSAAHTPGGSDQEVPLLGAAAAAAAPLRSEPSAAGSGSMGACEDGKAAVGGRGLWVPDASTSTATAAAHVGDDGRGGPAAALLLSSQDARCRVLPAGGWPSDGRHGTARIAPSASSSALEHDEVVGAHRVLFGGACQGLPNAGIESSLMQESSGDCKPAVGVRGTRSPYFDQHMRATRSHQTVPACKDAAADVMARDSRCSRRTGVEQPFSTIHNMVNVVELQALPTTCRERKRPVNHT